MKIFVHQWDDGAICFAFANSAGEACKEVFDQWADPPFPADLICIEVANIGYDTELGFDEGFIDSLEYHGFDMEKYYKSVDPNYQFDSEVI